MKRTVIVKDALVREINAQMESLSVCRNFQACDVTADPGRTCGANWSVQPFRHTGHIRDQAGCQRTMGEFIADLQSRFDIAQ